MSVKEFAVLNSMFEITVFMALLITLSEATAFAIPFRLVTLNRPDVVTAGATAFTYALTLKSIVVMTGLRSL